MGRDGVGELCTGRQGSLCSKVVKATAYGERRCCFTSRVGGASASRFESGSGENLRPVMAKDAGRLPSGYDGTLQWWHLVFYQLLDIVT